MKEKQQSELLVKWMDDQPLSESEQAFVNEWRAEDPELEVFKNQQKELSVQLRTVFPSTRDVPYPDFFNTKVRQNALVPTPSQGNRELGQRKGLLSIFRSLAWPLAAAMMAVCFMAGMRFSGESGGSLSSTSSPVYTPDHRVSAQVINSGKDDYTLIILEGLDEIPSTTNLISSHQSFGGDVMPVSFNRNTY